MNEQEYNPNRKQIDPRKIARILGAAVIGLSSLTACSRNSDQECGNTVKLDLNSTPNAFLEFNDEEYALYVDDFGDTRQVGLSKGKSMQEQFSNEVLDVDLEGEGKTKSGSVTIDGIQVSFTSAAGRDTMKTDCHKIKN